MKKKKGLGRGWHGNTEGHRKAGAKGGTATSSKFDTAHYQRIGYRGGLSSGGKFKKGEERTINAGKKGGKNRGKKYKEE